jgi:hypothetical protein
MMSEAALLGTQVEHSGWPRRHVLPFANDCFGSGGPVWPLHREHHDSPDLDRWIEKQNRYTTAKAITAFTNSPLADTPRLLVPPCCRMWLKKNFSYPVPHLLGDLPGV